MNSVPSWRAARAHLIAIALVYALVIPVAWIDQGQGHSGGGNWISLDLRGLLVVGYLLLAGPVVAVLLMHMSVKKLRKRFNFGLVVVCLFGPACMVPIGAWTFRSYVRAVDAARARRIVTTANALADAVNVRWLVRPGVIPGRCEVELTSPFAVDVDHMSVSGSADSRNGDFISSRFDEVPLSFRLEPGVSQRVKLLLDHDPTPDTYWRIYASFNLDGTRASVSWADPSMGGYGADAERQLLLH
jgi:hypothetical protein